MSQLTFLEQLVQERKPLSVSALTSQLKQLVEAQFFDLWVEGEISNFRRHSSGHWYFSLKDEGATLRCASFRMQNRLVRFRPEDGLHVRARGRLSLYEPRGEYQLVVDYLEPVGVGALQLAFEQLKTRLAVAGFFDPLRKRALPLLPRTIGLVTSPTGAALRDILRIIRRRNESVGILIAPASVQGDGASLEIARAIEALNSRPDIDVIIIGRGGGSIEDLWAFNEECVAKAIFSSRVPVISAVGHETDFTISDFVADLRASTPSAAAEMVAIARHDAASRVASLNEDLVGAIRYRLLDLRGRVSGLESSRAFQMVVPSLQSAGQRIDAARFAMETALRRSSAAGRSRLENLKLRLSRADSRRTLGEWRGSLAMETARAASAIRGVLDEGRRRLSLAAGKLDSLSPLGVLSRGYAIAFDARGRIIKRAAAVNSGDKVRVRVAQGELDCTRD
jgi:exodeoxyribonuclease VII large subunit